MEPLRYSVVVPVYNEIDSLQELHGEISRVIDGMGASFELIFVDDGSNDGSSEKMDEIAAKDPRVKVIHFVRNSGKSAAYTAAFEVLKGQYVLTLDADLQDDPNEIPAMTKKLEEGWDLVVGWKQGRLDNEPLKAIPSRFFNGMLAALFGLRLHDSNCGFRIMRKAVAQSLDLYGDHYRFIPQLTLVGGFKVTEQGVNHRKRKHGVSKYGARRFVTGFLDVVTVRFITLFGQKPLHFFGAVSFLPLLLGTALELYVLVAKLLGETFQEHVAAIIIGVLLLVVAFQCIITGLIGEMLSAQFRRRPLQRGPNA